MDIDPYLQDLERRIEPTAERELWHQWTQFADGQFDGELFSPRRPEASPPGLKWPHVGVNRALEDYDAMALQQLGTCSEMLAEGDGRLLCVRCNYGTGILPTLFGADLFVMDEETDTLPTATPLDGPQAVERLLEAGPPDLHAGLGGRVFAMAERYRQVFAEYPKIGEFVTLYHPDTQGPMDVCELLWGSDLFLDIVDRPGLVRRVLKLITDTYVRFMREWQRRVPSDDAHSVHWSMLHRGRIMLRDDSAMNLSPQTFDEFIRPWDERLLREFGGGGLHFCGRGDHWIDRVPHMKDAFAVNLSQPEYNDMEAIFRATVDRGVNVIGLARPAAEDALQRGRDLHGRVHCF